MEYSLPLVAQSLRFLATPNPPVKHVENLARGKKIRLHLCFSVPLMFPLHFNAIGFWSGLLYVYKNRYVKDMVITWNDERVKGSDV